MINGKKGWGNLLTHFFLGPFGLWLFSQVTLNTFICPLRLINKVTTFQVSVFNEVDQIFAFFERFLIDLQAHQTFKACFFRQ